MITFAAVGLGHLVGDYLLQNVWMAKTKTQKTKAGLAAAIIHCLLYTLAVGLICWNFTPLFIALVFASHYPIDRWSLGTKWLRLIRGRDIEEAYFSTSPTRDVDLSFAVLVYAVADNALHLLLLYIIVILVT